MISISTTIRYNSDHVLTFEMGNCYWIVLLHTTSTVNIIRTRVGHLPTRPRVPSTEHGHDFRFSGRAPPRILAFTRDLQLVASRRACVCRSVAATLSVRVVVVVPVLAVASFTSPAVAPLARTVLAVDVVINADLFTSQRIFEHAFPQKLVVVLLNLTLQTQYLHLDCSVRAAARSPAHARQHGRVRVGALHRSTAFANTVSSSSKSSTHGVASSPSLYTTTRGTRPA